MEHQFKHGMAGPDWELADYDWYKAPQACLACMHQHNILAAQLSLLGTMKGKAKVRQSRQTICAAATP